ncbi:MAG: hypothetical protein OQK12_17270 [Motiliproteus sp.]|nr:hypothetical protein [Motiliproteus sp.]MCW9052974.1 hypothetical protein [Motiliproteus sp.]
MLDPPDSAERPPPVSEILAEWDGVDLMVGVQILAKYYPSRNLKEALELTSVVEHYRLHHKVKPNDGNK